MQNRILMIIGGSSDIGQRVIEDNFDRYDKIIVHYFKTNVEYIKNLDNRKIFLFRADLRKLDDVYRLVDFSVQNNLIPTDIIYLAAGTYEMKHFSYFKLEKFEEEFIIGVEALVIIAQSFIPYMQNNRFGKIIIMLSASVEGIPPKYVSYYVVSKYAMLGLMKALDAEFYEYGIQINAISPDMIKTKFWESVPELVIQEIIEKKYAGKVTSIDKVLVEIKDLLFERKKSWHGINVIIR